MDAASGVRRRIGDLVVGALAGTALVVLNVAPGWGSMGFLNGDAAAVTGVLNLALAVLLVGSVALLPAREAPLLRGLRDALGSTLCLVALARFFVVFPFPIAADSVGRLVVKVLLGLLMVAAFLGLVAGWSRVARALHVRAHLRR